MNYFNFNYLYRDGGNYKCRGSIIVFGIITPQCVKPFLFSGEYFVPQKVGLDNLCPIEKNEDDHELHEIESIAPEIEKAYDISASVLINRFRRASNRGWLVA